ncbi:MAG: NADP-dependent oxidoreductase [Acidimicrobiaceae bacterium]|nr:NADP-dependent oxidoreductase [Acidimicrobiaceae bacterium]
MKAVGVIEYGGPDALQVVELPDPVVGPGQVRIRVHAAAVSPTDTLARNGARADIQRASGPPPYVPGMDAAGVLDAIGDGVETDLSVGDHVMAIVAPEGSHGAYSELIVVPAESVAPVPAGATDVEACTLPMNGLTARLALDVLQLHPGQTLAVTGAAGAFGGYVVQLAKADGLTVVADASEADEQLVRRLGADVVVRRGDDFAAQVRQRFPDGTDGAADGALLDGLVAPAVRDGAIVVTVRGYSERGARGVVFRPIRVRDYVRAQDKLDGLRHLVEQGKVTLRVAGTVPKERAAEAHRRLEAGGTRGRMVIEF